MQGKKVGVIGAMDSEVEALVAALHGRMQSQFAGLTFYEGKIGGTRAVIVRSGIGKVCAAMCAQTLIDRFGVDALINTGVAGGLGKGLCVGDFVIGRSAVQHDFDLTAFGYARGYMGGDGGDASAPTVFCSDEDMIRRFRAAAEELDEEIHIVEGRIASGDVFVARKEVKEELRERFQAAAAEMEGAAIAQVAVGNGIPFVIVRAISDLADGGAQVSFDEFERHAANVSAQIVSKMLENFGE